MYVCIPHLIKGENMVLERYERNVPSISEEEQKALAEKKVLIVGCGGLGGYLIEHMVRLGVGEITCVDGDVFAESNLNRQLYSSDATMGKSKALVAKARALAVNPNVNVIAVNEFLTEENADALVAGKDLVLDALDNPTARLILEDACAKAGIDIVHGAVNGWLVQVCVVPAGSMILHDLYETGCEGEINKSVLAPVVSLCTSLQANAVIKMLTGKKPHLYGKLLMMDTLTAESNIVPLM